jgi:hypothetical protein
VNVSKFCFEHHLELLKALKHRPLFGKPLTAMLDVENGIELELRDFMESKAPPNSYSLLKALVNYRDPAKNRPSLWKVFCKSIINRFLKPNSDKFAEIVPPSTVATAENVYLRGQVDTHTLDDIFDCVTMVLEPVLIEFCETPAYINYMRLALNSHIHPHAIGVDKKIVGLSR